MPNVGEKGRGTMMRVGAGFCFANAVKTLWALLTPLTLLNAEKHTASALL